MHATMSTSETYLLAMILIFSVPYFVWRLFRTDRYAPLVVVQIIGGVLLGPGVLGAAYPEYYKLVFSPPVIGALNGVATWGVMLFVMLAGLEIDLRHAWTSRKESGVTAALALGVPLLFGCGAATVLMMMPGWVGPKASTWQFTVGIGMGCAVTALPILMLLLEKLGILRNALGQRMLRYSSLDDVAIWGVLALILMDWTRIGYQLSFGALFALATVFYRQLMPRIPQQDRWFVALIWVGVVAFGSDWAGLHYMVGAFLAGAVSDSEWFDQHKLDELRENILLVIMPVFFLSTGLRTNWSAGGMAVFFAAGLLLFAAVGGKLCGAQIAGRILGWKKGEANVIGWLLQTKGLIEIIFANILLDKGIITSDMFTALLLMAVASTMLTIPIVAPKLGIFRPDQLAAKHSAVKVGKATT